VKRSGLGVIYAQDEGRVAIVVEVKGRVRVRIRVKVREFRD
jgi:hypothetical protein